LGYLAGPLVGYAVAETNPRALLFGLVALTSIAFAAHVLKMQKVRLPSVETGEATPFTWRDSASVPVVIALAAAKAVAIGWEPNVAWWATHTIFLGPTLAGVTFLIMGLAFALGAAFRGKRRSVIVAVVGLGGFGLLELAVRGARVAFWPAAAALGFWFGAFLTRAMGLLGWNRPERLGRANSAWMIATDLPMALAPVVVWHWRDPEPGTWRAGSGFALLLLASAAIAVGERAATRSVERS
jgi:hypothetical protein